MAVKLNKEVAEKYNFNGVGSKFHHRDREVVIDENLTLEKADRLFASGFGHLVLKTKKTAKKAEE